MDFDVRCDLPEVSVCLITYNHAPYIRECLDSMLMQQTDFPFEICLGEDESTDGTREICIEYAENHPDRIRLILRSQSEPGRSEYLSQGVYNYIETTKVCRGKYVAMCDGDDAWLDPLKLQKQFDILENDPSVAMVHSDCELVDEVLGRRVKTFNRWCGLSMQPSPNLEKFICDLICRHYLVASSTTMMRTKDVLNIFEENQEVFRSLPMGDTPTWCELAGYGSFHYIDEPLGLYRILPESDSNSKSAEVKFRFVNRASNLGLMLGEKYDLPMDLIRATKVKNCNRHALLSGEFSEIERLYSDSNYRFALRERLLYFMGRNPLFRKVVRNFFQLRYNFNAWWFRAV